MFIFFRNLDHFCISNARFIHWILRYFIVDDFVMEHTGHVLSVIDGKYLTAFCNVSVFYKTRLKEDVCNFCKVYFSKVMVVWIRMQQYVCCRQHTSVNCVIWRWVAKIFSVTYYTLHNCIWLCIVKEMCCCDQCVSCGYLRCIVVIVSALRNNPEGKRWLCYWNESYIRIDGCHPPVGCVIDQGVQWYSHALLQTSMVYVQFSGSSWRKYEILQWTRNIDFKLNNFEEKSNDPQER